jgi:hypothetical protein
MQDYESHCIIDIVKINIYYFPEARRIADTLNFGKLMVFYKY